MQVEIITRNIVGDLGEARRRLGDSGHVRAVMGDVLDESARLGADFAKTYAPKGARLGIVGAISSQHATRAATGGLEASAGVARASSRGMSLGAEGDKTAYPYYVHEGTGLYGKLARLIRPRRAKAMRWVGRTGLIFAKTTKGQQPQPYIKEAFEDLLHYIPQRLDMMVARLIGSDR